MRFLPNTLLLLLATATATSLSAQSAVNWASDVAPILYQHCVQCHRDGAIGGFSLLGYSSAYTMREEIADATGARRMPPWKADPNYRHYTGENYLSEQEIQTIAAWVAANGPMGDLTQAPPEPTFIEGSQVGIPDHVLQTPVFTITASEDEYRCFVIPSGLAQTAYLRGLELIPGNHQAVHHVLIYQDTTGQARLLDEQTPNEAGYVNFGGPGVQGANLVGAWVPGATTLLSPPNMGVRIKANADLIVQMHYPAGATGLTDQSTLNLFFTPTNTNIREIKLSPLLNHSPLSLDNWPLNIPPNTVKEYHAKFTVPGNYTLLSVAPHMHLIGRSMTCFGVTLQGDTIPLVRIPEWDFHWQGAYYLRQAQKVSIGTKLHAYATYDNTENNPFNPNSPPQTVTQGESTTDEMMLVYFAYLAYQPGDENLILDSTLLSTDTRVVTPNLVQSLQLRPNPAADYTVVQFSLLENADVAWTLADAAGRVLRSAAATTPYAAGYHELRIEVTDLPAGTYFVQLKTGRGDVRATVLQKQ